MKIADAIVTKAKQDQSLKGYGFYPLYSIQGSFPQIQYRITNVTPIRNAAGQELRRTAVATFFIVVRVDDETAGYGISDEMLEGLLGCFDSQRGDWGQADILHCKVNGDSDEGLDPEQEVTKYITKQVSFNLTYKET